MQKRAYRAAIDQKDVVGRVRTTQNLALSYHAVGRQEEALKVYERCLAATYLCGDVTTRIRALHDIANIYMGAEDYNRARVHFQQSLQLARDVGAKETVRYNELKLQRLQERLGRASTSAFEAEEG